MKTLTLIKSAGTALFAAAVFTATPYATALAQTEVAAPQPDRTSALAQARQQISGFDEMTKETQELFLKIYEVSAPTAPMAAFDGSALALQAAQQQKKQAAERRKKQAELAKWLHKPIQSSDNKPISLETLRKAKRKKLEEKVFQLKADKPAKEQRIQDYLNRSGGKRRIPISAGKNAVLMDIVYGHPIYYQSMNADAADTISTDELWPGGSTGFNLTGSGTTFAMWDENAVRKTHGEFTINRVTQTDATSPLSFHSTAVAGTLVASGLELFSGQQPLGKAAKGMSFEANLSAFTFEDDLTEMGDEVTINGLQLSNHSYGFISGWQFDNVNEIWRWFGETTKSLAEDFKFGFYFLGVTNELDGLVYDSDDYLPVYSAGNDRAGGDLGPATQPIDHFALVNGFFQFFTGVTRPVDGSPNGFDTMSAHGSAKNLLTVGSVDDIIGGYNGPGSVTVSSFSSFGPTDDGRIKPDVMGNGLSLITPLNTADSAYQFISGTSFSAPNVTGSLNLIRQLYLQLRPNQTSMLASTLKGIAIHTTDEAGNTGPDYKFGWGLMNAVRAATLVEDDANSEAKAHIKEVTLLDGDFIEFPVLSDGTKPLKITICWTDLAGTPPAMVVDPVNLMLVNDLDIRIIKDVATHFPWVLNPVIPSANAVTGDNFRDNIEQVFISNPVTGEYTVKVTHKGSLQNGLQKVSILVSGNIPQPKPRFHVSDISTPSTDTYALLWPAVVGQNYKLQSSPDLNIWTDVPGEISATKVNVAAEVSESTGADKFFYRVVEVE